MTETPPAMLYVLWYWMSGAGCLVATLVAIFFVRRRERLWRYVGAYLCAVAFNSVMAFLSLSFAPPTASAWFVWSRIIGWLSITVTGSLVGLFLLGVLNGAHEDR